MRSEPISQGIRGRRSVWLVPLAAVLALAIGGGALALVQHHKATEAVAQDHARAVAAQDAKELAKKLAKKRAAAKAAALLKRERQAFHSCQAQLTDLSNALNAIDSRLDVGMTESDFLTAVGDASIAYNGIRFHAVKSGPCLGAGVKMEDAFNQYAATSSTWNNCITDLYCDTDSITPSMQTKWSAASRDLQQARSLLQKLNPSSPNFNPQASSSLGT